MHSTVELSLEEYLAIAQSPGLAEQYSPAAGKDMILIDCRHQPLSARYLESLDAATSPPTAWHLPNCPVIAICQESLVEKPNQSQPHWVDMVVSERQLPVIKQNIENQAVAAATLVQITRHSERATSKDALFAESLAYSVLQQSEEFQLWLSNNQRPLAKHETTPLLVERHDNQLNLCFNRPDAHNAYNAVLRDALCEALNLAYADRKIERVNISANGPSFCAGGDLSEFGSVDDAAMAHLSRTTRSAAELMSSLHCPIVVTVHGACIGAGIELPAFAGHIKAHIDSYFLLPELSMGLIPGAGGTVSIVRRIGRHKCNYMAISNQPIDTATALSWGLVDELWA